MTLVFTVGALTALYKISNFKHVRALPMVFDPELVALKRRAHAYSGIDPEAYHAFRRSLDLAEARIDDPDESTKALYEAIGHLDAIAMTGVEYEIDDDIESISTSIGVLMETKIRERARYNNIAFHGRYLEE
tara:strand:+ start:231 stop:626 length:396 start_codon:yes stop_codon:yes gene_type:complete